MSIKAMREKRAGAFMLIFDVLAYNLVQSQELYAREERGLWGEGV